jgi:hypothetical protein
MAPSPKIITKKFCQVEKEKVTLPQTQLTSLFYFERKPFFQKLPFVLKDSLHYCSLDLGFKERLLIFLLA